MDDMEVDWPDPGQLRRLTRVEYERLWDTGFFHASEKVELLRGLVVQKEVKGLLHEESLARLLQVLVVGLNGRAQVRCGAPIALSDNSMPEPDLTVLPLGDYSRERPPTAIFVVEISFSRVRLDRNFKSRLYAEEDIPEYVLVDLPGMAVEIRDQPSKDGYLRTRVFRPGDSFAPTAFPDLVIPVSRIIPQADA